MHDPSTASQYPHTDCTRLETGPLRLLNAIFATRRGVRATMADGVLWARSSLPISLVLGYGRGEAQNRLGFRYAQGHGVPRDYREAANWYRQAAGLDFAQVNRNTVTVATTR